MYFPLYPKANIKGFTNKILIDLLDHRMRLYEFYRVESYESGKNIRKRINQDITEIRKELGIRCQKQD